VEYYNQNCYGKSSSSSEGRYRPARTKGPPRQRYGRTKIEICNDIGKSTYPYGKTTGHTDIRQLTGQLAPNSLDFSQVALSVSVCN